LNPALLVTSASALGIRSVSVRRLRIAGVVTILISGTITTAVVSIVTGRKDEEPEHDRKSPLLLSGMLGCYVIAAAVSGVLALAPPVLAAVIPLFAIASVHAGCYRH
jgi:hypothetical protein